MAVGAHVICLLACLTNNCIQVGCPYLLVSVGQPLPSNMVYHLILKPWTTKYSSKPMAGELAHYEIYLFPTDSVVEETQGQEAADIPSLPPLPPEQLDVAIQVSALPVLQTCICSMS